MDGAELGRIYDIVIVDDNARIRVAIRDTLRMQPDLRVVGEAANGQEGYELAIALRPHILVTDMRLGKLDGVAMTRRVKAVVPEVIVIGTSVLPDEGTAQGIQEAGAVGLIAKDTLLLDLVGVIRKSIAGESEHGAESASTSSP